MYFLCVTVVKKIFKMLLKVINIFKVLFPKTDEKLIANVNNDTKTVIIRQLFRHLHFNRSNFIFNQIAFRLSNTLIAQ